MRSRSAIWTCALSVSLVLWGCNSKSPKNDATPPATDVHAHAEEGPHQGHLIELGDEEYHAELVHDDAAGKVIVYLLDSHAKGSVAADTDAVAVSVLVEGQPKEFSLNATDAAKRDQFESDDKQLVDALDHDKAAKGRLRVSIGGKSFNGDIEHEKHEH